jgi:hypothetical protein
LFGNTMVDVTMDVLTCIVPRYIAMHRIIQLNNAPRRLG